MRGAADGLPAAQVRALLGRAPLPALTPRTLTDQGELTADLATLRHGGWLTERGESALGQNGIAAPVFGGAGDPVAAARAYDAAHARYQANMADWQEGTARA